jgi:hypothetical protein
MVGAHTVHQQQHRRQRRGQRRQRRCGGVVKLLGVVSHQQHPAAGQGLHDLLLRRATATQAQGLQQAVEQRQRVDGVDQRHEGRTVEAQARLAHRHHRQMGRFHGQAPLAGAARPEHRHQALRGHQREQPGSGLVGPNQARQVVRQARRRSSRYRCRPGRQWHALARAVARTVVQSVAQSVVERHQAQALVGDPLVVETGQQFAPPQRRCDVGLPVLQRGLKSRRIAPQRTGHGADSAAGVAGPV